MKSREVILKALTALKPLWALVLTRRKAGLAGIGATALMFMVSLAVAPGAAFAATPPSKTLELPTAAGEEEVGSAVAEDSELMVVGAQIATGSESKQSGKVYVFEKSAGTELALIATLESPTANQGSLTAFGSSVAVDEKFIVVGADRETPGGLHQAGRAYVFKVSEVRDHIYTPHEVLERPAPEENGLFGLSVAISGEDVAVGAPLEEAAGHSRAGHAYIYDAETGIELKELTSQEPAALGQFGRAVAIGGDDEELLVSAPEEEYAGGEGRVYVYENVNTGDPTYKETLTSPDAEPEGIEEFGSSVAISGDLIAVGAERAGFEAFGITGVGAAYVFEASTGAPVSTLAAPAPIPPQVERRRFGASVAITGDEVIVGAPEDDEQGTLGDGAAYVFAATGGGPTATLEDPNPIKDGTFGAHLAASGDELLLGAPRQTRGGKGLAGNAYVYSL